MADKPPDDLLLFGEIATTIARSQHIETWRAHRDDYLEMLARDFFLGSFPVLADEGIQFWFALTQMRTAADHRSMAHSLNLGSLEIFSELGVWPWTEIAKLTMLDYDRAGTRIQIESLAIREELGNRAGMADSYHVVGSVSHLRGSYDQALIWYRKSRAINEELGRRSETSMV